MGIFSKLFGKKEEVVSEQPVQKEPDYKGLTGKLVAGYLVNSYSASLRQGAEDTRGRLTTIARLYQPLTFKQYCDQIRAEQDVTGGRGFDPEIFLNQTAKIILSDGGVNQELMDRYCSAVSTVYEGLLATSRSQQVKADMYGRPEVDFELNTEIVSNFRSNLQYGLESDPQYKDCPHIFTRQGFERCGQKTLENAREAVAQVEREMPEVLEFSLEAIQAGVENAQAVVAVSGKDFYPIKPQDEIPQIDQGLREESPFQEIDNVQ